MEPGFGGFGGRRLEKGGPICGCLVAGGGVGVRRLGGGRTGEMRITRFLHNPKVTAREMLEAAAARTCSRVGGWTGYYGKPGPIVMLRGLTQLHAIKHGWNLRNV